jgi:hypothetical protein
MIPMFVVGLLVAHNPHKHTVTVDSYHMAAQAWWSGQNLYVGPSGMNYLPHFAVLFSPFHFLPFTLGEILWRYCAAATLAVGLWRLARAVFGAQAEQAFFWMTILTLPLSMASLRNGNANALFGGVCLLAIAASLEKRWTLGIFWMALSIALKPLGIVLLGLASLYFVPVIRRLPAAIIALAIFPFLFGSPHYVWGQEREAWINLRACATVTEHRFADFNGILRTFGSPLSGGSSTIVRAAAGVLTAVIWLWGARRITTEATQNLWLYALATGYLMLFNPMTEANSYVILAPALAAWAVYFLLDEESASRAKGWTVAAIVLGMGLLPNLVRWFVFSGSYFALFWHPLMTILFLLLLTQFVARRQASSPSVVAVRSGRCA